MQNTSAVIRAVALRLLSWGVLPIELEFPYMIDNSVEGKKSYRLLGFKFFYY